MAVKDVKKHRKRRSLYPWSKWFALSEFTLRRGEDYSISSYVMGQQIRNNAPSKVTIKVAENSVTVKVGA